MKTTFKELQNGNFFRFSGYDDLLKKTGEKTATMVSPSNIKPLARKGDEVRLASPSPYFVNTI